MNSDDLRALINRLAELALELQGSDALTARPAAMSGRVSVQEHFPAPSHEEWLATRRVDTLEVRSAGSKAPGSVAVMDLRTDVPELLNSWADAVADELHLSERDHAVSFLLYHRDRILEMTLRDDLVHEFRRAIRQAEEALGLTDVKGLACGCGRGRLSRDDFNTYICSGCSHVWTADELKMELRNCVTVPEAAILLDLSQAAIRQRISRGKIAAVVDYSPRKYRLMDLTN